LMKKKNFGKIGVVRDLPFLLEVQHRSFEKFLQRDVPPDKRENVGLQAVFNEFFPVEDIHGRYVLEFIEYHLGRPRYTPEEAEIKGVTYAAPLRAKMRLVEFDDSKQVKNAIEQDVYLGDLPLMTERGSFIINGVQRVIVNQLHRAPGVYFEEQEIGEGRSTYTAQIIPYRGAWIEFVIEMNDTLMANLDRRRKFPATILLKALMGFRYEKEAFAKAKPPKDVDEEKLEEWRKEIIREAWEREISKREILELLFDKKKKLPVTDVTPEHSPLVGKVVAEDVVDKETGEILIEYGTEITPELVTLLQGYRIKEVTVFDVAKDEAVLIITNGFKREDIKTPNEAVSRIYQYIKGTHPPNKEIARSFFTNTYFNQKKFDLSKVGRRKINQRFNHGVPSDLLTLAPEDFIETIKYIIGLIEGRGEIDDIDHLGNRRVRGVGELLEAQFRLAFTRLVNAIKEKMIIKDTEEITPQTLINSRIVSNFIHSFFATNQLSQFMDQTNPLAETTHKRRLSALGPGGLTRETAGFEVRDVHYTHYGRICPIETPEGPNIGLITSLATYARVNEEGFIETPYRKVVNGKVTDEIVYLSAEEEDKYVIAQANVRIDKDGNILDEWVLARKKGTYPLVRREEVQFMDLTPKQITSVSASLIPFLEHDDANRALMGSNMQRQAVPLLQPERPLVATGVEGKVARDSGATVIAKRAGKVVKVTSDEIWIEPKTPDKLSLEKFDIYKLVKFKRTNQNTTINQRPLVKEGDEVKAGQVIADGAATSGGELALGHNVLVAFLPYLGWNYEDAIVISESLLRDDKFTSIHIEEFVCEVRETKLGPEELTREVPNVAEEKLRNLDEDGIVRIGSEVEPGDILVGKVSPKGETELTPEEKLLRAIFGEKAADVKDTSLKVPPGVSGIVVDVKVLSREPMKEHREEIKRIEKEYARRVKELYRRKRERFVDLYKGKKARGKIEIDGRVILEKGEKLTEELLYELDRILESAIERYLVRKTDERKRMTPAKIAEILPAWMKEGRELYRRVGEIIKDMTEEKDVRVDRLQRGDELPPGVLKIVKVYVGQRRKISIGDKLSGRHGNKGVIARIVPVEDMPYLEDGTPVEIVLNPLGVPSRMNVGQILETHLGWACRVLGYQAISPVFEGATIEEIKEEMKKAGLPEDGKVVLYDGRTGEPFREPVTVGYIYMMKLIHMVDDKIHARAIGPYSLITQQPLGGKAQFGGQRFGEMEVWALEAYGAAHTLQEMLTVKSDDVPGRTRMYESIIKGENPPEPGLPASFHVLIKELNGLGINVELGSNKEKGGVKKK